MYGGRMTYTPKVTEELGCDHGHELVLWRAVDGMRCWICRAVGRPALQARRDNPIRNSIEVL